MALKLKTEEGKMNNDGNETQLHSKEARILDGEAGREDRAH
jgi:hypothetical protein